MPHDPRTRRRQSNLVQRAYNAAIVRPLEPTSLWIKLIVGIGLAALPGLTLAIAALLEAGVLQSATPHLLFQVIGAFVLVIGLDAIGALYVAGQIITPVEGIREAARRWKRGDLAARIEIEPSSAEFTSLIDNLNAMATSLEESRARIRDAERRLRLETDRLRAVLDTSPAGVLVIGTNEVVQLANPAAEALLGEKFVPNQPLNKYEVIRHMYRSDGQPYPYEDLPTIQSLRNRAEVSGAEIIVRRPNGWEEHLLVNSAPIRDGGGVINGAVALFFDVSALAEEERLRNEFVTSAAHEFRNPLTVIKGYAEIAMRDPSVKDTPVYRELARILDAADRVEKLAVELQHAAQMHLTPITLHKEVVDLGALAESVAQSLQVTDPQHVYQVIEKSPCVEVEGDPALLREAVEDVVRQAKSVSPTGAKILVKVWSWDGISNLSVTDFGPSVPPDAIPALFNPFTPLAVHDGANHRQPLLLYLAKRIVEESGGWIRGESSPSGTTITLTLPRYIPESSRRGQPTLALARGATAAQNGRSVGSSNGAFPGPVGEGDHA